MDFLFTHIMDNRFKINESLDIDRHISKIEEDHAYLYIKKVLVPVASKVWNKSCQGSKLFINFTVTPEQICRNIKKVGHWKFSPNDKTTTDVIRYESDFPGDFNKKFSGPFRFEIYKSVSGGKLVASLKIPSGEENHYEVGEPVNENIKIQKDVNSEPPISKMEEYKALDFIKKKIVPIALMSYNKYFRQPRFTPFKLEDIVKNLKKINIDFPTTIPKDIVAIHSAYDPRITYGFEMGGEKWAFIIFKSLTNRKMYATWRHPYFSGRKFYHVGDPLNEGLESNKDAEVPERLKMTRRDEAEGLQFIKKVFVKYVLNRWTKVNKFGVTTSQLTDELIASINKTLLKTEQGIDYKTIERESPNTGEWTITSIPYEYVTYKVGKPTFLTFRIYKDIKGKLSVGVTRKNIGVMAVNVRGSLTEGRIKIINRPPQVKKLISKLEEDQALQYIIKVLIPWAFYHYNSRLTEPFDKPLRLKSFTDISKNLRKVNIQYDPADKIEYIEYKSPSPNAPNITDYDFRFIIWKGEDTSIIIDYRQYRDHFGFNLNQKLAVR